MAWAIIDTSIYIDHWQGGRHAELLAEVQRAYIPRFSSVVLSELRRGARTAAARRVVEELFAIAHVQWAPLPEDWWIAGDLVRQVGDDNGWNTNKRREFQNDALIALTARRYGAAVVTSNAADFAPLAIRLQIPVLGPRAR